VEDRLSVATHVVNRLEPDVVDGRHVDHRALEQDRRRLAGHPGRAEGRTRVGRGPERRGPVVRLAGPRRRLAGQPNDRPTERDGHLLTESGATPATPTHLSPTRRCSVVAAAAAVAAVAVAAAVAASGSCRLPLPFLPPPPPPPPPPPLLLTPPMPLGSAWERRAERCGAGRCGERRGEERATSTPVLLLVLPSPPPATAAPTAPPHVVYSAVPVGRQPPRPLPRPDRATAPPPPPTPHADDGCYSAKHTCVKPPRGQVCAGPVYRGPDPSHLSPLDPRGPDKAMLSHRLRSSPCPP
jgi:hypothetical protein